LGREAGAHPCYGIIVSEVAKMSSINIRERKIKDLSVTEFKHLIRESIAEDIEAWRETFEIMSNKTLMSQIRKAEAARRTGRITDFIPWEKVKKNV
jgi:hypothetical protein